MPAVIIFRRAWRKASLPLMAPPVPPEDASSDAAAAASPSGDEAADASATGGGGVARMSMPEDENDLKSGAAR